GAVSAAGRCTGAAAGRCTGAAARGAAVASSYVFFERVSIPRAGSEERQNDDEIPISGWTEAAPSHEEHFCKLPRRVQMKKSAPHRAGASNMLAGWRYQALRATCCQPCAVEPYAVST